MSSTSTGQNIQKHFQKCPDTLIFNTERLAFSWKKASSQALTLPSIAGVYALFSHGGERIQKVGKAKGFQYILNSESLLLADGPNLTADVKKELGF